MILWLTVELDQNVKMFTLVRDISRESGERRGSGPESGIEDDLGPGAGDTSTLSRSLSLEVGSYVRWKSLSKYILKSTNWSTDVRPPLDNIDFFADTLDIRKDAIRPYDNYNPQEEEELMSNLGALNDDKIKVAPQILKTAEA